MTLLEAIRTRFALRRCAAVGAHPVVTGRVWVHGAGDVRLGHRVRLDAREAPVGSATKGAEITIGDDAVIEGGTSIEARRAVTIGPRARIEGSCKILDNDLHTLDDLLFTPESWPVVVEADARLGRGAILLPGAHVRAGGTVRAGTVVRGSAAAREPRAVPPSRPAAVRWPGERLRAARRAAGLATAALRGFVCVRGVERAGRVYAYGRVRLENRGAIRVGDRVVFVRGMIPTRLACQPGGTLDVGDRTIFNYGATIEAHRSIRIGRRCMVASSVRLCDAGPERTAPIVLGDDVWLAHGVVVEPGVTIGEGSVVSAGSVVKRDVPPRSLAAGNPARSVSLALAPARGALIRDVEPPRS